jgi:hypothetical protein
MNTVVLASRFDLPFYLRLPGSVFLTWDPEDIAAAILPRQRLGQVSFSKTTNLVPEATLLDAPSPPAFDTPAHKVLMACETKGYGEVPTLHIDTSQAGGYAELRPYTEVTVFLGVSDEGQARGARQKVRVFKILNHFLALYRLVTQDPWVDSIDPELDLYLIDDAIGIVPKHLREAPADQVLLRLNSIQFATEIGDHRQYTYRLNTLEDLHPGKVLEKQYFETFVGMVRAPYELPLHYDLILTAQVQLKRRQYHMAVLEAETAFEVYIADLLMRLKVNLGEERSQILADMEDPRRLGLHGQRLRAVDAAATLYSAAKGLPAWAPFVSSPIHREWRQALSDLRNRVVHGRHRQVTFEDAKRGLVAGKSAIKYFEDALSDLANRIQIYAGGDHLQNTAGRLRF